MISYTPDEKDREILRLLIEDGRISSTEIARRIPNLTERAARYRINKLVENGVITVRAIVDPRQLGFPVTADVWMAVNPAQVTEVSEKLTSLPRVTYVAHSFGDQDVIIQVVARDVDDLHAYLTEVIGKIPGVQRTNTYIIKKLKEIHDWFLFE